MKTGRTLTQLAQELDRQANEKRDFLLDTRACEAMPHVINEEGTATSNGIALHLSNMGTYPLRPIANGQISSRLNIPKKYYDRMLDKSPDLLCTNINHWFNNEPENRMVRTLDGNARAFLSDRYRPLDNYELAEAVLPVIGETEAEIDSCEITEAKMYIKATTHRIQGEVRRGDVIQSGIIISNSEVGHGSLSVYPFLKRLVCLNGMTVTDFGQRKYHVGRSISRDVDLTDAYELFTDKTKEISDRAFWHQVRDVVRGVFSQEGFDLILESLKQAAEVPITAAPMTVVERTQKALKLSDAEKGGVLQHLFTGGDLTKWGLANAVTRTAEDADSYDRASELEELGWTVIEMTKPRWEELAVAKEEKA